MAQKEKLIIQKLKAILKTGTGETWMEQTIFHGVKISIFQFIADHAGHKELHLQLLIDSTLNIGKI
jgi:hypothetical protein